MGAAIQGVTEFISLFACICFTHSNTLPFLPVVSPSSQVTRLFGEWNCGTASAHAHEKKMIRGGEKKGGEEGLSLEADQAAAISKAA